MEARAGRTRVCCGSDGESFGFGHARTDVAGWSAPAAGQTVCLLSLSCSPGLSPRELCSPAVLQRARSFPFPLPSACRCSFVIHVSFPFSSASPRRVFSFLPVHLSPCGFSISLNDPTFSQNEVKPRPLKRPVLHWITIQSEMRSNMTHSRCV